MKVGHGGLKLSETKLGILLDVLLHGAFVVFLFGLWAVCLFVFEHGITGNVC